MTTNRYAPDVPFPAYAFVPGRFPHPVSDSDGHHFGLPEVPSEPLDPRFPMQSRRFLEAIDLFNAGYYWEAHEAWEHVWIAVGRTGVVADFLKALIKLAAAGVKSREGQTVGVQRHARRAAELFRIVRATQEPDGNRFAGLPIDELIRYADSLAEKPVVDVTPSIIGLPIFSWKLTLELP